MATLSRELFKTFQRHRKSSTVVCNENKILGFVFFVNDVIGGVGLGVFGRGHQAPTTRRKDISQVFIGN